MYPVYDLTTEGGKQALNQRLLGFGPGGMADSLFPNLTDESVLVDRLSGADFDLSGNTAVKDGFKAIMSSLQGGTEASPTELLYSNFSESQKVALSFLIPQGVVSWKKVGNPDVDGHYIPVTFDNIQRCWANGGQDDSFTIDIGVVMGTETGDDTSKEAVLQIPVYSDTLEFGSHVYINQELKFQDPDSSDELMEDNFTIDTEVLCTSGGRVSPRIIYEVETNLVMAGFISEDNRGSVGDIIIKTYLGPDGEVGAINTEGGSIVHLPIATGCPSDLTPIFRVDPEGESGFDGTILVETMKEDFPEYDWDHPITKPYSEEVGLSATKKHFIRIS